ncbi:MAG: DUF721 domain-containing protein [Planctomycetota bacterium]|nr:DUF721 domain-containing protein [Planctomycetota bacterium]
MAGKSNQQPFDDEDFLEQANFFSKRQIYRRKPKKADEILGRLLARKGYQQNESNRQIEEIWESIIDTRLKGQTRATGIRGGKLQVVVNNAVINQELAFKKRQLLEKIKDSPLGDRVRDIRFQVGVF